MGVIPYLGQAGGLVLGETVLAEIKLDQLRTQHLTIVVASRDNIVGSYVRALESYMASEVSLSTILHDLSDYRTDREAYFAGASFIVAGVRIAADGPL